MPLPAAKSKPLTLHTSVRLLRAAISHRTRAHLAHVCCVPLSPTGLALTWHTSVSCRRHPQDSRSPGTRLFRAAVSHRTRAHLAHVEGFDVVEKDRLVVGPLKGHRADPNRVLLIPHGGGGGTRAEKARPLNLRQKRLLPTT